ncbi:MAG: hypothetical protein QOJ04_7007 [Caballeronia sp.]|nr:hypothetical protein [Caballeronia sp.]
MLGVKSKRHVWTNTNVSTLRRTYPTATRAELMLVFPGLRHWQIYGKARHLRLYKVRSAFKPTGFPVIDEIRARALKLRLSMVDLDALARTKRYFQQAGWHGSGLNGKAICRAIEVLDGEPWPRWRE